MISDQPIRDRVTHDHETLFAGGRGRGHGQDHAACFPAYRAFLIEKKARH